MISNRHALGRLVHAHSLSARLLRRGAIVLGVGLGLYSAGSIIAATVAVPQAVFVKDFVQEYLLAKAVVVGESPYQPVNLLSQRYLGAQSLFPHPSPHPPPVALLFLPLSILSYRTAAVLWLWLQLACLALSIYLLARGSGVRFSPWAALVVAAVLPVWYPVRDDLRWGQLNLLLLLALAGARLALVSGRSATAGLLVGLSVTVKLFTWPLVLLLLLRSDWRALRGVVFTIVLGYGISGWVVGFDRIPEYFGRVVPEVTRLYQASVANMSAWSVGSRLFSGTGTPLHAFVVAPPLARWEEAAVAVSVVVAAAVLVVAGWVARRQGSVDAALGITVCSSILVSPLAWPHYEVLLLLPATYVVRWLASRGLPSKETNSALVVGMLLLLSVNEWTVPALMLTGQWPATSWPVALPFAPALFTLGPTAAVAALGSLVAVLGSREDSPLTRRV